MTVPRQPAGPSPLRAFGETPAEMAANMEAALDAFEAQLPAHAASWLAAPAQGRWSPAQVAEHVLIVNEGVGRIVGLLLSDKPLRQGPRTPGETLDGRRLAPPGLEPGDGTPWADLQPRWQASQQTLRELGARLPDADLSRRFFHPFMNDLDAHDWYRMATYHTRHHRRQLGR